MKRIKTPLLDKIKNVRDLRKLSEDNLSNLSSTTSTIPMFGSIVQKGKLAASAFLEAVKALKRVDFPTFGSPTIPHLNPIQVLIYFARKKVNFFFN